MQRAIVGYQQDADGDWVAELACGHRRHVRHRPPIFPHEWILDEEGRQERLGTPLDCLLCDQEQVEAGGEAACFANLLCPACGAVLDGGPHRPGCPSVSSA